MSGFCFWEAGLERNSAADLAIILDQQETIAKLQAEIAQLERLLWQATEYVDPLDQYVRSIH